MVAKAKRPSQADYHVPQPAYRPFDRLPAREPISERSLQIIAEIRERLKNASDVRPNKDWAQRVLDRHAAGEHICQIGLTWAREIAAEQAQVPQREPGSDDA